MIDKEKVRILYEKMSEINYNLGSVINTINNTNSILGTSFVVDDKIVENDNIEYEKDRVSEVKASVNGTVLEYLRSNF